MYSLCFSLGAQKFVYTDRSVFGSPLFVHFGPALLKHLQLNRLSSCQKTWEDARLPVDVRYLV